MSDADRDPKDETPATPSQPRKPADDDTVNEESTPGTGMLPDADEDPDETDMQPTG